MRRKDPKLPRHTTREVGAMITREKLLARDPDYYKKMGAKGGKAKRTKPTGFQLMTLEQRMEAGRKGGTISRRKPKEVSDES